MGTMDMPAGSTDCHVHAFGDPAAYPFDPARAGGLHHRVCMYGCSFSIG